MFRLAHLSDPHLAPLPSSRWQDLMSKRLTGYLSWYWKRRTIHQARILELVVRDIKSHDPDHVAVTGDLINIALAAEYRYARRWLEELGSRARVSLVPGNHDASVPWGWGES